MDRNLVIKKCYNKMRTLNKKLINIKNYSSSILMLKDVNRLLNLEKEIQVQKCHTQYFDICIKRSLDAEET